MNMKQSNEDGALSEFFGNRYAHLLNLYKKVAETKWQVVMKEMKATMGYYDEKSREIIIDTIKHKRQMSLGGKRSINCLAVGSALFCKKFHNLEPEGYIDDILDSLHGNVTCLLPYLGHGIVVVRMVEIMLYVMVTICHDCKDEERRWADVATKCFHHPAASREIKLASAIIVCEFDEEKKYVDLKMFSYLHEILNKKVYYGIKQNYIEYSICKVEDKFKEDDRIFAQYFGERYAYLLNLHRNVQQTHWQLVLKEMKVTLKDYADKSRDIVINSIKNKTRMSLSSKKSINCLAVESALLCKKFRVVKPAMDDDIEADIFDIVDRLYANIKSLLPYLSHGNVVVRMVEIQLYARYALLNDYNHKRWSHLLAKCFRHPSSSREIKLSSSILICELDLEKKCVDKKMFVYLHESLLNETFLGFEINDIKSSLSKIQDQFQTGSKIKEAVTVPRDSGFQEGESNDESSDMEEEIKGDRQRSKTTKKHPVADKEGDRQRSTTTKKNSVADKEEPKSISKKHPLSAILTSPVVYAIGGAIVAMVVMWILMK